MLKKYMIHEEHFKNFAQSGKVIGFEVGVRLPYYRGVAVSLVDDFKVTVDGETFTHDDIKLSVGGYTFTYDQIATEINRRWEFGEVAKLIVEKSGGLVHGEHNVKVEIVLRISYLPWLYFKNEDDKKLTIIV